MSMASGTNMTNVSKELGRVLAAVLIALVVAFVIIFLTSTDPFKAFETLLTAPLSSKRTVGLWVDDIAKLTLSGLAFALVFQARQFALGVQGQVYIGGMFAAYIALSPLGATWMAIPLGIMVAMIAGAAYGFLPGYAKARFGASEIVSSLMLNYIAIKIVNYVIRAHFAPEGSGQLMSEKFEKIAIFPAIIPRTRFDLGIIIALIAVFVVWFLLYRTSWGLRLRLVGQNPGFAEYSGIRSKAMIIWATTISGAIGGLLGAVFVHGRAYGRIAQDFEANLAFEGILITIVAKDKPLLIPVVAVFYGYLRQGAQLMGIRTDVPTEVISIVQAVVILLVASSFSLPGKEFWGKWIGRTPPPGPKTPEVTGS